MNLAELYFTRIKFRYFSISYEEFIKGEYLLNGDLFRCYCSSGFDWKHVLMEKVYGFENHTHIRSKTYMIGSLNDLVSRAVSFAQHSTEKIGIRFIPDEIQVTIYSPTVFARTHIRIRVFEIPRRGAE